MFVSSNVLVDVNATSRNSTGLIYSVDLCAPTLLDGVADEHPCGREVVKGSAGTSRRVRGSTQPKCSVRGMIYGVTDKVADRVPPGRDDVALLNSLVMLVRAPA